MERDHRQPLTTGPAPDALARLLQLREQLTGGDHDDSDDLHSVAGQRQS